MNIEIVLTPTTGPIDEPLHGLVRGLPPGECVTVRAQMRDSRDLLWRSHLTLRAERDRVATMDADELIASLTLNPNAVRRPFDTTSALPLVVEFTAEYAGRVVATEAQRLFAADDVLTRRVRERSLSGLFFQPASLDPKPAVIVLSGSTGALAWSSQVAALLARRGFAALALAYFDFDELPSQPTGVLDGKFALGGTPPGQAAANRAAWRETVAFLRESLGWSSPIAEATTAEGSPCR